MCMSMCMCMCMVLYGNCLVVYDMRSSASDDDDTLPLLLLCPGLLFSRLTMHTRHDLVGMASG